MNFSTPISKARRVLTEKSDSSREIFEKVNRDKLKVKGLVILGHALYLIQTQEYHHQSEIEFHLWPVWILK